MTDPTHPAPPAPPPFAPVHLKATWQRDWRFGTELVDAAVVSVTADGIFVSGRRTNPIRGVIWLAFRLGWSIFSLGVFVSVVLTCIGITWRNCVATAAAGGGCDGTWVWFGPLIAVPGLWLTGWIVRRIVRRYVEPVAAEMIPWEKVATIATDGRGIDLAAAARFGSFRARLAPKAPKKIAPLLAMIRERRLPGGRGGETGSLIRSPWIDRAVALGILAVTCWGAVWAEPWITGAAVAVERPEDAVPPAMTARGLDAHQERACAGSPGSAGGVRARREGTDLVWDVSGSPGGELALLRMKAGDARFEVVDRVAATSGRKPGFFTSGDEAGVAALLAPGNAVGPLLASGRVEDLSAASCAGLVLDVGLASAATAGTVMAERDGEDLLVDATSLPGAGRYLVVRRRAGTRGALFRWCEVPADGDDIHSVVATPGGARFPSFFTNGDDEALVYFVPTEHFESARRLAVGGVVQRCLGPESLVAAGAATLRGEVTANTQHAAIRWRTGVRAHAAPMFPTGCSADAMMEGVARSYVEVRASIGPSDGEVGAFDEAFFDAVDWTAVFDTLNFGRDLNALEALRRGVARAGGDASATYALLRVGEAFLERFPAEPLRYSARAKVGQAWLAAPEKLGLAGDAGEAWRIVGRFVLADIGRHLEDDINGGRVSVVGLVRSVPLMVELADAGVRIDIQPSNTRKVLVAWLSGDFEYLLDRALKKGAQALGGSGAFGDVGYTLDREVSVGKAVRMSRLLQDGDDIGWVAQYDGHAVRARWVLGSAVPGDALLAMSAAYTEADGNTTGVALLDGRVHNWLWKPDMGGLIVVGSRGGLDFLDMRRGGTLGGLFLRPGSSLVDFSTLLRRVQDDGGSAFQTYLLAGDGELRLNPDRSSQEHRERRLLALAVYKKNPIYCVVDLPSQGFQQGYTLYQAAEIAMKSLQTPEPNGPGLKVLAVANLDTGAKDFLIARDGRGQPVRARQPEGVVPSNLLVLEPS